MGSEAAQERASGDISRLEGLFFQLEEDPSADAVFKATTTILRNATLRAIQKAVSSKGQVDAEALVQATAGRLHVREWAQRERSRQLGRHDATGVSNCARRGGLCIARRTFGAST